MQPNRQMILKVTDSCNLKCSYCYFYANEQHPLAARKVISEDQVKTCARLVADYCRDNQLKRYGILLHGGEPLLPGLTYTRQIVEIFEKALAGIAEIDWAVQTNGALVNEAWASFFKERNFVVGVSIDGTRQAHDRNRRDWADRGSYDKALAGLRSLKEASVRTGVLCTAQPGDDGREVYRALVDLGVTSFNVLLPDYTYDDLPFDLDWLNETFLYYFTSMFDEWTADDNPDVRVQFFESALRVTLGSTPTMCTMAKSCPNFVSLGSNGRLSSCDVIGPTGRLASIPFSDAGFGGLFAEPLHEAMQRESFLPSVCRSCTYLERCGGHCPTTRFSRQRGFDNPSIYCQFFKRFFDHVGAWVDSQKAIGARH